MKLNVLERVMLRNILPHLQGNFGHIKEARELRETLFTPEEETELQLHVVDDGSRVVWRETDETGRPLPLERDITISDGLKIKIANQLKALDRDEMLTAEHLTLYEKFCPPKEEKAK